MADHQHHHRHTAATPPEGPFGSRSATEGSAPGRDDRVLRATRILGAVIVPFLLVAFVLLYFFPDDTRHWFAWDVQPTITPLIMGAGYIAGAYFFVRVALETRWHRSRSDSCR